MVRQSPTAARNMIESGFPAENISYYRGGMQNWQGLGLTVVPGAAQAADVRARQDRMKQGVGWAMLPIKLEGGQRIAHLTAPAVPSHPAAPDRPAVDRPAIFTAPSTASSTADCRAKGSSATASSTASSP